MPKAHIPKSLREAVFERAERRCEYCNAPERVSPSPFSAEHILPESRGGATDSENLACSCQGCNNHKGIRTEGHDPKTDAIAPLFHPRQHLRAEHFAWSEDYTHLIGLTPTGRATIATLHLNREGLVNLRRLLITAGQHPPIADAAYVDEKRET
jgi:hypothetical protein